MNSNGSNHYPRAQQPSPGDAKGPEMSGGKDHVDDPTVTLLPTKAFQVDPNTIVWRPFPKAPVRWTAQPILEWVESLAAAAEQGESQQAGRKAAPISIAGVGLSAESPPLPPAPPNTPVSGKTASTTASSSTTTTTTTADFIYQPCPDSGRKRVHTMIQQPWPTTVVVAPMSWDLAYIQHRDPVGGSRFCSDVSPLAVRFESLTMTAMATDPTIPSNRHFQQVYNGIKSRLEFKFGRILDQCPYSSDNSTSSEFAESRKLLNALYNETMQKMQALIEKASPTASSDKKDDFPQSVVDYTKAQGFPKKSLAASALSQVVPKKDFSKYMTAWLRDNWINPYPDEDGLADMAHDCGTTSTVVSNWLINARTRKWRPAIVKATDRNRPSELLLEDSIRIFDGRPLRSLHPLVGVVVGDHGNEDGDDANRVHGDSHGGGDCYRPTKRAKRSSSGY
jgi:hypothetical protein